MLGLALNLESNGDWEIGVNYEKFINKVSESCLLRFRKTQNGSERNIGFLYHLESSS